MLIFAVFAVLLLIAGVLYAVRLPQLQITHIEISGNQAVSSEAVRMRVEAMLGGNFALIIPRRFVLFPRGEDMAAEIKKEFPIIENIEVIKNYPNSLIIHIAERKFFAVLCNDLPVASDAGKRENGMASTTEEIKAERETACAYIDRNGFAYDSAPQTSGTLILRVVSDAEELEIPSQMFEPELADKIEYLVRELPKLAGERVTHFELLSRTPREFRVKTASGFLIFLNRADNMEKALKVVKTVLEQEVGGRRGGLEYVDARFGNKVFFKWK